MLSRLSPPAHHRRLRRRTDPGHRRSSGLLLSLCCLLAAVAPTVLPALPTHAEDAGSGRDAPTIAAATEPWDGPAFSADPAAVLAAVATLPTPEKSEIEFLLTTVHETFDVDGLVSTRTRRFYRLLDTGALDGTWSTVDVQWSPWYQERPEVRARVITPDGAVRELAPSALTEAAVPGSDPSMFEDTRRLRAPLPGLTVGAVVETESIVRRQRPFFAAGQNRRLIFAEYSPVRRARIVVELPEGFEINLRARQLDEPEQVVDNGRRTLTYEAVDLPSLRDRDRWLPPEDRQLGPTLDWSTGRSWAEVADAYRAIVDERIEGAEIGELLEGLGKPGDDRDAWLATLLVRLHRRVRYTGVELDEARIVPRSPAETLARGFGDCKDKAVLLVAALRQAGIPAYVALLKSGFYRTRVDPEMPGLGQFNHAIVYLPGDPATWIDATDPFSRPGELAAGDRGRNALVIAPGSTGLTPIPEATAAENRLSIETDVYLAENGKGRVIEVTELHGALAANRRSHYFGETHEELENRFESHVAETYGSEELVGFEVSEPDDLSLPLRQRVEAGEAERAVSNAKEAVAVIQLADLFAFLPPAVVRKPDEPRESVIAIDQPYRAESTTRIHLPPGLALRKLPDDAEDELGPALFQRRYRIAEDGRRIDLVASFELDRQRLDPEEMVALREGIEKLAEDNGATAVIWFDQTVYAHTAAGRLPEAIGEARRLMDLHPDEALHSGQLAEALLTASLGAEARRAARRGTELEPESAAAWSMLGRVLLHDEVGRRYRAGYDRAGAIEALRRAAELDPDDASVAGDLAIALEHDDDGVRYGDGADLEDAVATYRQMSDHLREYRLAPNLAVALLRLGRYDELREVCEEIADESTRNQFTLAAVALTEGPQAAIEDATRRYPGAEARAGALANAGQDLLSVRRYGEAAELARVAARQSSRAAHLLTMAETLDRAVPYEELIRDGSDPKNVYIHLLALLIDGDEEVSAADLGRLMAPSVRAEMGPEQITELIEALRPAMRASLGETPTEVGIDLAAASLTSTGEGDDDLGYRIRLRGSLGTAAIDATVLMVREGESARVVAILGDSSPPAGLEVLRRIERGDLAGARQWLDWSLDQEWRSGRVDDPFSAEAFPRFWTESGSDDPEVMRLAAAILAAPTGADRVIEILEAARGAETDLRQASIDEALLQAYAEAGDGDGLTRAIDRLRARIVGESLALYLQATVALADLERRDELTALGQERLDAHPEDPWALRMLGDVAQRRGELERSQELFERLLATGEELPGDLNNAAWVGLATDSPPTARHLELVRRALTREENNPLALHTLAALLAASGKPAEARQVLLQSLEINGGPPDHSDLYVLGLLAEAYGLPDAAERYYSRVVEQAEESELDDAISPASLARARAAALRRSPEVAGD